VGYTHGAPETKTCPEYFARQNMVGSVYQLLPAYKHGSLGNVLDLPAPLVEYLGALESAINERDQINMRPRGG
jgi:hypothetical protein